jgi:hypothetical protein
MWLEVQVRAGNELVFHGGAFDDDGALKGVSDELDIPDVDVVKSAKQVPVYEQVAADAEGRPTTTLGRMATKRKDTRLLPAGWKSDGPHAGGHGADGNRRGRELHRRLSTPCPTICSSTRRRPDAFACSRICATSRFRPRGGRPSRRGHRRGAPLRAHVRRCGARP